MELNFKQTLFSLDKKNSTCNDCGDSEVKYVSINNGITLCELCAQIHKNFGYEISFIRDIDDQFDEYLVGFFIYGGNKKFRKKLRSMGVNLDQKKGNLYRTYGADFYRRNLKSIVKGNSHLDIDFENANEVMKNETNNFPEFANYIVNSNYEHKQINNNFGENVINNELGGLNLNIDLGFNNINNENDLNINMANDIDLNNNNNNQNNINDIQINPEPKKIESVENKPEAPPSQTENKSENNKVEDKKVDVDNKEDEDSAERKVKKAVKLSIIGLKKLGNFMKKSGIKTYDLAKKYGKASAKVASEYVKKNFSKK
jgi:hypothetical protein